MSKKYIKRIEDVMLDSEVFAFFKRATGREYNKYPETCVNDIRKLLMQFWNEKVLKESPSKYETPEQYKERTGKNYPDDGPVWYRFNGRWMIGTYHTVKLLQRSIGEFTEKIAVIIATPENGKPTSRLKTRMNEVDFIKWMINYADGFSCCDMFTGYNEQYIIKYKDFKTVEIGSREWNKIYYPLLLQKAIEGIKKITNYNVDVYFNTVNELYESQLWIYKQFENVPVNLSNGYESIDQAKEEALIYIYEYESKK